MNDSAHLLIVETLVADSQRLDFLPRHFGSHMLTVERWVYMQMGHLSEDYQGGYWDYYDLSNGGCYIAPAGSRQYNICVETNGYSGAFDAKGAGIVATLFTLSFLSFRHPHIERFAERFYQLRNFALTRHDAAQIFGAID
jgi:Antirestriction protein